MSKTFAKLTHKRHDDAVYVDQVQMLGSHNFKASAILVRNHEYFNDFMPTATCLNPMFLLETARQIETIISHKYYNVAESTHFVLLNWSFIYKKTEITDNNIISVSINTQHIICGKAKINSFKINISYNGNVICRVHIKVRYVTDQTYKFIRKLTLFQSNTPCNRNVLPEYVGYSDSINVCLNHFNNDISNSYAIIDIPSNNTTFNDHIQDHITGMNISEAVKQTCYCYLTRVMNEDIREFIPVMMDSTFFSYVEHNQEAMIVVSKVKRRGNSYWFYIDIIQNKNKNAFFKLILRGNNEHIKNNFG